jgi:hypothetical protein
VGGCLGWSLVIYNPDLDPDGFPEHLQPAEPFANWFELAKLDSRPSRACSNDVKTAQIVERAHYAASLNAPTSSNQGCRRFHLGQIWATISKSLILNG